jgi:magnesium transporter
MAGPQSQMTTFRTRHRTAATRRRRAEPGAPPGTLVPHERPEPPRVIVRAWDAETLEERELLDLGALSKPDRTRPMWLDVVGLSDADAIARIGQAFGFHALSLEDVIDPTQRPKAERYEAYTFVMLQALSLDEDVRAHPLGLFFGEGFVVTFREPGPDPLEPVRRRLMQARGRLRGPNVEYLAYAIVDTVVDHIFPVLEQLDDRIAALEDAVLEARTTDPIGLARRARHDVQMIRHVIRPTRDAVAVLAREDGGISAETRVYLRDCYDHVVQLSELAEASREAAVELLDTYVSTVTMRTNEVMKALTVVATIFIPLTFIAGVYGMNFDVHRSPYNMPELRWTLGYPFALSLMVVTAALFLVQMRRRGWLERRRKAPADPPSSAAP